MGDAKKKVIQLTWEGFDVGCLQLAQLISEDKRSFDSVYGVPRGGLFVAVRLSHLLNLPLVLSPKPGSLVVDDISDTGKTLMRHKNKGRTIVTLYTTPWTKVVPAYSAYSKLNENTWVEFPWERMG